MKLWQTGSELHPLVESFTVGTDYIYDQKLLPYDIIGSRAHAQGLEKIGILTSQELEIIEKGLDEIQTLWEKNEFQITQSQEDCHTAIEQYLTEKHGEVGKKIHTGRSRNDQVLTMIRLFLKAELQTLQIKSKKLNTLFVQRSEENIDIPLPGYTHAQKAMPTTIGKWLESFAHGLTDQLDIIKLSNNIFDQSPLGSAAGFGTTNLKLDRDFTSTQMGFAKVQENPLYCGLSRGLFEYQFLQSFISTLMILSRFNTDLLLFTMQEFGYCTLPTSMTTGSSIMPQKRNYDCLEIMRGRIKSYVAKTNEIQAIYTGLMSGYNRDIQLVKPLLCESITELNDIFDLMILVIENLKFDKEKCKLAMTDDLYATEKVYDLVAQGMPFREAYMKIKKEILN